MDIKWASELNKNHIYMQLPKPTMAVAAIYNQTRKRRYELNEFPAHIHFVLSKTGAVSCAVRAFCSDMVPNRENTQFGTNWHKKYNPPTSSCNFAPPKREKRTAPIQFRALFSKNRTRREQKYGVGNMEIAAFSRLRLVHILRKNARNGPPPGASRTPRWRTCAKCPRGAYRSVRVVDYIGPDGMRSGSHFVQIVIWEFQFNSQKCNSNYIFFISTSMTRPPAPPKRTYAQTRTQWEKNSICGVEMYWHGNLNQ